jgi:hypothetical protein
MKYPVEPCPNCGCGDADEDAKTEGLTIAFHPQSDERPKLLGSIFYVCCNRCGYIGPIVLCEHGLSQQKVTNAWNEHIKPGSMIAKEDLVRALAGREGVETITLDSEGECWEAGIYDGSGPAKILVVVD